MTGDNINARERSLFRTLIVQQEKLYCNEICHRRQLLMITTLAVRRLHARVFNFKHNTTNILSIEIILTAQSVSNCTV